MNKDTERLKGLIVSIRDSLSPVVVCDSSFKCSGWEEGMEQIEAAQIFCSNHSAGPKYTAPVFKFCPWCGKEIYKKIESTQQANAPDLPPSTR